MPEKIKIALSIGANEGNIEETFSNAFKWLEEGGLENIRISNFYKTSPVGCASGTPDFINGALTGLWDKSIKELFQLCKALEEKAGRPAGHEKYSSRPLDLDIVFFGGIIYSSGRISVPHKETLNRLFVLIPLADVASDWIFPGKKETVGEILEKFKTTTEYKAINSRKIDIV